MEENFRKQKFRFSRKNVDKKLYQNFRKKISNKKIEDEILEAKLWKTKVWRIIFLRKMGIKVLKNSKQRKGEIETKFL